MHGDTRNAPVSQVDAHGLHQRVDGRFARTVRVRVTHRVERITAQHARNRHDDGLFGGLESVDKHFRQCHWRADVDVEDAHPFVTIECPECLVIESVHCEAAVAHRAGIVDQHVDGALLNAVDCRLQTLIVREIRGDYRYRVLACERVELVRTATVDRNDLPAVGRILAHELEPQTAIGTGYDE